jgi:hypothetical protein
MITPADLLAALAMMLGAGSPVSQGAAQARLTQPSASVGPARVAPQGGWIMLEAVQNVPTRKQVRIEQRVVIRIVPRSRSDRQNMSAFVPAPPPPTRMVERKAGRCLPVSAIGAVQPGPDNRLMLFMRDRRMFSARLEKSCNARDFYSGFYVERNDDGMICVDRDRLQSRSGAKCQLDRIRQLVPER